MAERLIVADSPRAPLNSISLGSSSSFERLGEIMKIQHRFSRTFFSPATIRSGFDLLARAVRATSALGAVHGETDPALTIRWSNLLVTKGPETIEPNSEDEFFADYLKEPDRVTFQKYIGSCCLHVHYHNNGTDVTV